MITVGIFLVVSAGITAFSWKSLRDSRSHGFCRFFALECILILLLISHDGWFNDPGTFVHIVSWILLFGSLALALPGFYLLMVIGRPKGNFENTTFMVSGGVYRLIRHPLYASLVFLAWGIFFKTTSTQAALLTGVATAFLYATARVEESENLAKFGGAYASYMKTTKMFIPYLL